MLLQPHVPTSALHRQTYSSLAVVLSVLQLVWASQPDRVSMPAQHCSALLPAEAPAEAPDTGSQAQDAQDLVNDSYVVPEWEFLPLPRQRSQMADMLACSNPSPQHDPGESGRSVIIIVLELVLGCPVLWTLHGQEVW